nr:uncharacterized protein I203_01011 [Kwoniella mangroviensis CBS 8507]OCF69158.1 hypothetical protein I203_01011 [Kwoniella mangroviensis CBS 8507]
MPPADSTHVRHRRSRTGCLTCRKLKHKCDEQKPVCGRCQRTVRICTYPIAVNNNPGTSESALSSSSKQVINLNVLPHAESSRDAQLNAIINAIGTIPPAITLVDLLALSIPDVKERSLASTVNLHAIPHPERPVNCFDMSECFQNRRGSSMEIDSFFLSIISIAAVHRSSMFLRSEKNYLKQTPMGRWGIPPLPSSNDPPNSSQIKSLRDTSIQSSKAAIEMGKIALNLKFSDIDISTNSPDEADNNAIAAPGANAEIQKITDTILTSIVCICISQVMLVSTQWKEAYNLGLKLVKLRGGPIKLLEEAKKISLDHLNRTRTLLENLAIIDVWHCLASGAAPTLLEKEFQPWWFDFAEQNADSTHPDSFQFVCGMDRGMLEVVNRINILVHEKEVLSKLPNPTYITIHGQKVQDMLLELDIWEVTIGTADRLSRVQLGNLIIAYTMRVVICVDLLGYPHSHPTVQTYTSSALNHLESSRSSPCTVNMLVPTLIVGSMMFTREGRYQAKKVIEALRSDASFSYDVEEALRILDQLYKLKDQGVQDPSWRSLLQDILLL